MSDTKNALAPRPDNLAFVYNEHEVVFNDARLVNITQMFEAAGKPVGKEPAAWRRREDASSFIADLALSLNVRQSHVLTSMRGKGGASWAHWQIALAYAKHLSNDFHRFVNEAFREWAEEKANPDLKAKRAISDYRAKGKDDRWIGDRLDGLLRRHQLTDTLKENGVEGSGFAFCTDKINRKVLGTSARELKVARGIKPSAPTRDHLTSLELGAIKFAETMAEEKVKGDCAHGNAACCKVCEQAGEAAYAALVSMGLAQKRA